MASLKWYLHWALVEPVSLLEVEEGPRHCLSSQRRQGYSIFSKRPDVSWKPDDKSDKETCFISLARDSNMVPTLEAIDVLPFDQTVTV